MHMFTKCTLLFTFNINEAFKKRFVPSIDKPERKKKQDDDDRDEGIC